MDLDTLVLGAAGFTAIGALLGLHYRKNHPQYDNPMEQLEGYVTQARLDDNDLMRMDLKRTREQEEDERAVHIKLPFAQVKNFTGNYHMREYLSLVGFKAPFTEQSYISVLVDAQPLPLDIGRDRARQVRQILYFRTTAELEAMHTKPKKDSEDQYGPIKPENIA